MDSKVLTRRCVVAKLREVTIDKFKDMVLQSAGGLIIMLPTNMSELSAKDREVRTVLGWKFINYSYKLC